MDYLNKYWGKLHKRDGKVLVLPLACHLADVACVFEALCKLPVFKRRLSRAMGREPKASDISRLACLAALHDLGKVTRGFQNKSSGESPFHGHIYPIPGLLVEANLHRLVEGLPWLLDWGESTVFQLLLGAFSHHGTPLSADDSDIMRASLWPEDFQAQEWQYIAFLGKEIQKWFPDAFSEQTSILPESDVLIHFFAGLVMLADWIGSDTRFFPILRDVKETARIEFSRQQAAQALLAIGLTTDPLRGFDARTIPQFAEQFSFSPNYMQQAMELLELSPEGGIVIVEGETGSGKTEAALRHFTRLWAAGYVDGLYFANPLRFAATQLFERVVNFAKQTFLPCPPSTVLAVPGYLRVDEAKGKLLPDRSVLWDDDPNALVAERRWSVEHPKRFLAAPISVGTIDQALLAGLRTPHAHLRAAGLCRSLLVIDEVHASDPYMTELTLGLLDLFHRLGGHVLLLSATLGGETRQKYLQAMGAPAKQVSLSDCVSTDYPLVSTVQQRLAPKQHDPNAKPKPHVRCKLSPIQDDVEAVAGLIAAKTVAGEGARVLVLRNSVSLAMDTLKALELSSVQPLLFSVNHTVCPHHSRYARPDRELMDRAVEKAFGKNGLEAGGVLVATQTLEQSLDVDFDLLITDLCPMDVLLQRLGRLFRHRERDALRPEKLKQPLCVVLVPARHEAKELRKRFQYGKNRAYSNVPSVMATWDLLAAMDMSNEHVRIPEMSRLLVEKSLHSEALEETTVKHGLIDEWNAVLGIKGAQALQGRYAALQWGKPFVDQSWKRGDPNPKTRLGTADLSIHFDPSFTSPFGQSINRLVIPEFLLPKGGCEDPPVILEDTPSTRTLFQVGDSLYSYTRFGLHKEKTP